MEVLMMKKMVLYCGLLGLSCALSAMNRSASSIIKFGEQQKEVVGDKYKATYADQLKIEVASRVSDAVIQSNCYNDVTNKVILEGGQGLARFGGIKKSQNSTVDMDKFGQIYGQKMKEKGGNIFSAFPVAVEEYCIKTHTTNALIEAAANAADAQARNVATRDLSKVHFPKISEEMKKGMVDRVEFKAPISTIE